MVLDTRNYCLIQVNGSEKTYYRISKGEMKLFRLLIDNNLHDNEEIMKLLNLKRPENCRIYITRLRKKIPILEIINIKGVGYILKTIIKIK